MEVTHREQQWLPSVRGCQMCRAGVGKGPGLHPSKQGQEGAMKVNPWRGEVLKRRYFIADHRGRTASCLTELKKKKVPNIKQMLQQKYNNKIKNFNRIVMA